MKFLVSLCFPLKVSGFSNLIADEGTECVDTVGCWLVLGPASAIGYYIDAVVTINSSGSISPYYGMLLSKEQQVEVVVPLDIEPKYSSNSCIASLC